MECENVPFINKLQCATHFLKCRVHIWTWWNSDPGSSSWCHILLILALFLYLSLHFFELFSLQLLVFIVFLLSDFWQLWISQIPNALSDDLKLCRLMSGPLSNYIWFLIFMIIWSPTSINLVRHGANAVIEAANTIARVKADGINFNLIENVIWWVGIKIEDSTSIIDEHKFRSEVHRRVDHIQAVVYVYVFIASTIFVSAQYCSF